jgi:ketosteroid isomerase-like protein
MRTIKEVIESYLDGAYNGDTKLLSQAFAEDAILKGFIDGKYLTIPIADFIKGFQTEPSMESKNIDFSGEIVEINENGSIANVTVKETNYAGALNFIDYFNLGKVDGEWKIMFKTFTTI